MLLDARVEEHVTDADMHSQRMPTYEPGAAFLLELLLSGTMQGRKDIHELWLVVSSNCLTAIEFLRPIAFASLQDILSRATSYSTLLVERAVVGLIRLCTVLVDDVRTSKDVRYEVHFRAGINA